MTAGLKYAMVYVFSVQSHVGIRNIAWKDQGKDD